jgi:hypothetical protein
MQFVCLYVMRRILIYLVNLLHMTDMESVSRGIVLIISKSCPVAVFEEPLGSEDNVQTRNMQPDGREVL